jgi:hypothetical protein
MDDIQWEIWSIANHPFRNRERDINNNLMEELHPNLHADLAVIRRVIEFNLYSNLSVHIDRYYGRVEYAQPA